MILVLANKMANSTSVLYSSRNSNTRQIDNIPRFSFLNGGNIVELINVAITHRSCRIEIKPTLKIVDSVRIMLLFQGRTIIPILVNYII